MSRAPGSKDLAESFQDFLTGAAKLLFWLGAAATIIPAGFLVYTCFRVADDPSAVKAALDNIEIFRKVLAAGAVGLAIGAGYLWWMEDVASALLLMLSAALFFAPAYVPSFLNGTPNEAVGNSLGAIQIGGVILGALTLCSLTAQIVLRVRERVKIGVRADQLKYGKGVKEEPDRQNVWMGSCWQLPYCRKFVRERCPIFHSKRTCWRERVGCMCEEEVIRNAMSNKPIPKDALLASKMIPRNHRLNESQKAERCRNCVIYNEHQRHKYRAALPAILIAFVLIYALLHGPLVWATTGVVQRIYDVINAAAIQKSGEVQVPGFFVEMLTFVGALVALTYALKILEFCVFKLKI